VKIKFDATDEEINNIRNQLKKWDDSELIREFLRLEVDLKNKTSEEDIKKYRIGFLTLALTNEELSKRGKHIYSFNKNE